MEITQFTNRWYKVYISNIKSDTYKVSDLREILRLSSSIPDEYTVEVISFLEHAYINISGDDVVISCNKMLDNDTSILMDIMYETIVNYTEILEYQLQSRLSNELAKSINGDIIKNMESYINAVKSNVTKYNKFN